MGGEADKLEGTIKEAGGNLTGDDKLKDEGKTQQVAGDVKNAGDKLKDKAEDLGDAIKK